MQIYQSEQKKKTEFLCKGFSLLQITLKLFINRAIFYLTGNLEYLPMILCFIWEVKMKIVIIILLVFSILHLPVFSCTIGVASPSVTTDGRALIWKNRDISNPTYVHYLSEDPYKFIGVGNENSDYIWMGINEKGFGILNAVANFPNNGNGRMGNGDTMMWALGHFSSIEEFDAFLDSTNIIGRETHANMAVLDSTGAAIMYEISENNYWKFDAAESESGFVVRGNFAFNGGGTTSPTYERSMINIQNLIDNNNLNCTGILQNQIRSFHNNLAENIQVPFDDFWNEASPFGYFPVQGISNPGNGSAVVIQGNLPDEPAYLITMWTLLGQPTTSVAVPLFAVAQPPIEENDGGTSALYYAAQNIKTQLFDFTNPSYVDSYKLINERNTGFWTQIFAIEEEMNNEVEALKSGWTPETDIEDLINFQNSKAEEALTILNTVFIETDPVPDFKADIHYGTPILEVEFTEISQHNPQYTNWEWDFDEDGIADAFEQNPSWNYIASDSFDVSLTVTNADSTFTLTKPDFIRVFDSAESIIDVNPDSLVFLNFEDATGLTFVIHNSLDIPIELNNIFPAELNSFYSIDSGIYDFPIYLDAGDSLETIVSLNLPVIFERELVVDSLYIIISNTVFSIPVYIDDSLNCDIDNEEIHSVNFKLQNFPNPFNPSTTISFDMTSTETKNVEILIYNIKGQKVKEFHINNYKTGINSVIWDGTDTLGNPLTSGIYYYKLKANNLTSVKKMMILK